MPRPSILLLISAAISSSPANSESASQMHVTSQAAQVEIEALTGGRRLIQLPALEFELLIELQCPTEMRAKSINISVADTNQTFDVSDVEEPAILEARMTIPRQQVSPVAVDGFCQADQGGAVASREMLIKHAFSAHISLRCANPDRQSINYASQPLDLRLRCNVGNGAVDAPTDQDSSPPSMPRWRSRNSSVRRHASSAASSL